MNNKLIEYLSLFNKKELRRLSKFLYSPYYNTNSSILKTFEYFQKAYPNFSSRRVSDEGLFSYVSPGKKFNSKKASDYRSKLTKIIENFWSIEAFEQDDEAKIYQKLKAFKTHKANKHYLNYYSKQREKISEKKNKDAKDFLNLWQLDYGLISHPDAENMGWIIDKLAIMNNNLDSYFILEKLHFSATIINQQNISSIDYPESSLLSEALEQTKKMNLAEKNLNFHLFQLLHHLLQNPSSKNFQLLLQEYKSFHDELPELYRYQIFKILGNHLSQNSKDNPKAYYNEIFSLNKLGLESGIYLNNNGLTAASFLFIINSAILSKNFDFADDFRSKYIALLEEEDRNFYEPFTKAFQLFHQKKYIEAAAMIPNLHSNDALKRHMVISLSVRCTFERLIRDSDFPRSIFESQLKAFIYFFENHKSINSTNKLFYLNFSKVLKDLDKLYQKKIAKKADIEQIERLIDSKKLIFSKDWLLEKLYQKQLGKK